MKDARLRALRGGMNDARVRALRGGTDAPRIISRAFHHRRK